MNRIQADIKDKLVALGLGTFAATTGWGIFINAWPNDDPNTAIGVYSEGGFAPGYVQDKSVRPLEYPTFQIRTRAPVDNDAWVKVKEVKRGLESLTAFNVTSSEVGSKDTRYQTISALQAPFSLGRDDEGRYMWAVNFRAVRQQKS